MVNDESKGANAPVATNATVDAVIAGLLTLLGLAVMYEARRLGAGWTTDGPGAGYFPFYIGAILSIGGAGILYQSLVSKNADADSFVDREQLKRVMSVLLPSAVYVMAIMVIGLYVASAIFIAVFMVWIGKYSRVKSALLGVAVCASFFVMFEVWFKVPLYKGAFDPLAFLGY